MIKRLSRIETMPSLWNIGLITESADQVHRCVGVIVSARGDPVFP